MWQVIYAVDAESECGVPVFASPDAKETSEFLEHLESQYDGFFFIEDGFTLSDVPEIEDIDSVCLSLADASDYDDAFISMMTQN